MSATVAILWLSFPIEVKVVIKGSKKIHLNFNKVFSFEVQSGCRNNESEILSVA